MSNEIRNGLYSHRWSEVHQGSLDDKRCLPHAQCSGKQTQGSTGMPAFPRSSLQTRTALVIVTDTENDATRKHTRASHRKGTKTIVATTTVVNTERSVRG